jgi:hypothetical protein
MHRVLVEPGHILFARERLNHCNRIIKLETEHGVKSLMFRLRQVGPGQIESGTGSEAHASRGSESIAEVVKEGRFLSALPRADLGCASCYDGLVVDRVAGVRRRLRKR